MLALLISLALPASPDLAPDDVAAWREHLAVSEAEQRFDDLDWSTTFLDGVRRAAEEERPLLFWAMNGHPLGCT